MNPPVPILLLKTPSTPRDVYADHFAPPAHDARFVPVLEHCWQDANIREVEELLLAGAFGGATAGGDGRRHGGLVFTSQRAVEAFVRVLDGAQSKRPDTPLVPPSVPLYVVGPATQRALASSPHIQAASIHGAHTGNGDALAAFIVAHYPSLPSAGSPPLSLLFLVGQQRRPVIPSTLRGAGIGVDEVVVYDAALLPSFAAGLATALAALPREPAPWIIVFSPTGCRELLSVLDRLGPDPEPRRRARIATIGPTTRDFLLSTLGVAPDVCAATPSPEGVGEGIRGFLERHG
ncbi:MAG: hypothetical protein M1832_003526 [Thelocarpon impressellum]|nr:MAG: hypothetical protein M1832_003526 [Thelocarpon impressellum]